MRGKFGMILPSKKKEKESVDSYYKDNYIPLFDGIASSYKEWRKRITIYYRKMTISKRQGEAVLNLVGSLIDTAWKLVEDFDFDKAEEPDSFEKLLPLLDASF